MLIQPHSLTPRVSSSQDLSTQRVDSTMAPFAPTPAAVDSTMAPRAAAVEQNPAVRAFAGESAFESADKAQGKAGGPKIDPSEFGGWAGDRLQLGKLIADNLKNL